MNDHHRDLILNVESAIADRTTETDVLQAAIEQIDAFSDNFHWTGFYMVRGDMLEIGPYIGPTTPHTRIKLGEGICGAAATAKDTIIVDDVNADPRFLACSITTRSEIVVPLMDGETCIGEIDIDSNNPAQFTGEDREMLEAVAAVVVRRLKQLP